MEELQAFSETLLGPMKAGLDWACVSDRDEQLSYPALVERVNAAVSLLAESFETRQNIVFVVSDNSAGFIVALFALNYLAQIVVPLFAGYAPGELRTLYDTYKPSMVIADGSLHPVFASLGVRLLSFEDLAASHAQDVPQVIHSREDVGFILMTSGSQGPAKGVVLTNGNVLSDIIGIQDYMQGSDRERCLITRSLAHASALVGELLLTVLTRGSCVLRGTPSTIRKLFDWCDAEEITWMGVAPVLLNSIVEHGRKHGRDFPPRRIVVSGAVLPVELCRAFLATFPRTELINAYGLTEASPRVAYLPAELAGAKPGSVGYAIKGCRIRVVSENGGEREPGIVGEIQFTGPNVMRGYFPAGMSGISRAPTEWLKTGDSGYRDNDGALYVVGRIDSMFVHNGLNIYPEYLSAVFERFCDVRKAEIVQKKLGAMGNKLVAFVELAEGVSEHGAATRIREHLAAQLDIRKHPDEIVIVPTFPIKSSGKVDVTKLLEGP